jgi:DSF synthase
MNQPRDSFIVPTWLDRAHKYLELEWNAELSLVRVKTRVLPIQCYSLAVMAELHQLLTDISTRGGIVKHLVLSSGIPGVFNFGGDLSLFVLLIRARDLESLKMYGYRCIELIWWMETASQRGVNTVVLVQGDALGGGL